jgi:hypothetical protein
VPSSIGGFPKGKTADPFRIGGKICIRRNFLPPGASGTLKHARDRAILLVGFGRCPRELRTGRYSC